MAAERLVLVALPEDEARAIVECVSTSGKTTYTGPGETLFNGSQKIEQALDGEHDVFVHDLETEDDVPVTRVTGGRDDKPVVLHTD